MNSDFQKIIEDIDRWPLPSLPLPAVLTAYQKQKESSMHKMFDSDLILAGVQACGLATRVLEIKWADPDAPSTQATIQLAHQVLESYGLVIKSAPPKAPAPSAAPATTDPVVDAK